MGAPPPPRETSRRVPTMLVLVALLLALIPAAAILYPFIRRVSVSGSDVDEGSVAADLARRWDAALEGLKSAELEHAIGNLEDADHRWLREQYMTEAALVLKALDLEAEQEESLLSAMRLEVRNVRDRVAGPDREIVCPGCSAPVEVNAGECAACGRSLDDMDSMDSGPDMPGEAVGD